MSDEAHRYLIALGSNVRHVRHGGPGKVLRAAMARLNSRALKLEARSPIMASPPVGPSRRTYANAAALVVSRFSPPEMLRFLKEVENEFGRSARGQRWSARTLDLDIVLWSGGAFVDENLIVPHPAYRARDFVLRPAAMIAPDWRDPLTGLTIRQQLFQLRAPRCLTRAMPLPS